MNIDIFFKDGIKRVPKIQKTEAFSEQLKFIY
jgi:hypothetical protein